MLHKDKSLVLILVVYCAFDSDNQQIQSLTNCFFEPVQYSGG